jgi:holo-[acyl-carrier protein] synthase
MMIVGVGVDLVDLRGFAEQLKQPGTSFVEGTFTAQERDDAASSGDPSRRLGARFAAKEAFVKAWDGAAFGRPPDQRRADLREIEVVLDAWGRPALRLHGAVAAICEGVRAHVSLSHDGGMATAVVVLERTA